MLETLSNDTDAENDAHILTQRVFDPNNNNNNNNNNTYTMGTTLSNSGVIPR